MTNREHFDRIARSHGLGLRRDASSGVPHMDASVDAMQSKMADLGFVVPVRVISEGMLAAIAAAPAPDPTPGCVTVQTRMLGLLARTLESGGDPQHVAQSLRELAAGAPVPKNGALTIENAPIGTKAPAIIGGHWLRVERGWQWNGGSRCAGSTFPRPGGDWSGKLIAPEAEKAVGAIPPGWERLPPSITEGPAHYSPREERAYVAGYNWCLGALQQMVARANPAPEAEKAGEEVGE